VVSITFIGLTNQFPENVFRSAYACVVFVHSFRTRYIKDSHTAYRNSSSKDLPQAAWCLLRSAALLSEPGKSSQVIRLLLAQPSSSFFIWAY